MSSRPWHLYLRPHRLPDTPAGIRLLLAASSGAILSLSYHGSFLGLYAWFCLALLLSSILGARPFIAFFCGFLHGLIFVLTCVPWIAEVLTVHGGMSVAAGWGVLLLIATVWGCSIGLFTWMVHRLSLQVMGWTVAGAPFLWISTEVLRAYLPEISFPWGLLGYPAAGNPALAQLTTITGIYGVSFLVAIFNSLLIWILVATAEEKKSRVTIVAGALVLLLTVQYFGPGFVPHAEAHHLARVVQPNFPETEGYNADWYADHQ